MAQNLLQLPPDLPVPEDDGAAAHLVGMSFPAIPLPASDNRLIDLSALPGTSVVYAYPRTGEPGKPALADNWDMIPGARGCTPQSCAFRDHHADLQRFGARVFGLSSQTSAYQQEAVERLHLPFTLLSDADFALCDALRLPTFDASGTRLFKRLTLIIEAGRIAHVFYPVFPPDKNADEVLAWLSQRSR